ncbi:MAG: ribonuclease III, partial [Planctomycetales bacterium]|nr:ribonuclease III [Planctomycetales bacterium]
MRCPGNFFLTRQPSRCSLDRPPETSSFPHVTSHKLPFLERCQRRLGYEFQDKKLLRAALTHASGAHHRLASNERLEFLGDAILGWVVCEMLYQQYPDYLEGDLTRIKSMVVSRQTCAKLSTELGLEEFLILGKGMASHTQVPPSLLSDVFEALVAAIYLDGGETVAREFIQRHLGPEIEAAVRGESETNYKSQLQQLVQREHGITPTYKLVGEKGPDHRKHFKIAA